MTLTTFFKILTSRDLGHH